MAKKTSGQNLVDEAYLRSLMAGVPSERAAKIEKPFYPVKKENRMTV